MNLLSASYGLITDAVLIVLLLIFVVVGCRKGFVKSFLSTFGSFFSIILAVLLCSTVANFLETKYSLITSISNGVSGVLADIFGADLMDLTLAEASNVSLTETNLSRWLIKIIIDVKGTGNVPADTTISQVISPVFGYYITCILSVIGLYFIFRIIFFIIGELTKALHKVKVVGTVDKLLGAVFGLVKGIIIIQILFITIKIIPLSFVQDLVVYIESSSVAKVIESINVSSYILHAMTEVNLTEIIQKVISNSL
ncbi:MAG: CvpA family protein [Clostridia bacterium]|nr:CvpA family protein [Clostridia bacterium]